MARRGAEAQDSQEEFFATLTNQDGTTETSPRFATPGRLMIWLGMHREGRACEANVVIEGKLSYYCEAGAKALEVAA